VGASLPEVECGFGTPREAMRLVRIKQRLRLLTAKTGIDLTEQMERFSRSRVSALRELEQRYVDGFMQALAQLATPRRHTNALQHMAGYFKDRLDVASKRELAETITDYGRGRCHSHSSAIMCARSA
jgi:uncharacterized protein YbgA (DUF1722 family)